MSIEQILAWPGGLPLLLAVPVVHLALCSLDGRRARRLLRATGPRWRSLAGEAAEGRDRLHRASGTAALLLAVVALLQPQWGSGARNLEQGGIDLMVCLDVSQSMLARDEEPSRLARARREIQALAERARGDRIGLVAFAGEARLVVPLTLDLDTLTQLVEPLDPLAVRRGGTDVGAALSTARQSLVNHSGAHGAVLLISDGEDLELGGVQAAALCRDAGIPVHCVGLGSALGSKIALQDESGQSFLRDRAGNEVVTAMDPITLRRIAETGGGEFVAATGVQQPVVFLYERHILPMARRAFEDAHGGERENRFQWPLLAALFLWTLELGLTDRKRR